MGTTYQAVAETVNAEYEPKIRCFFEKFAAALAITDFTAGDVLDFTDEEYAYDLPIKLAGDDFAGVRITILEERVTEGEGDRFAFDLTITGMGGQLIGRLCPHNYTPALWVNVDGLADRWAITDSSVGECVERLVEWSDEQQ